MPNLFAESCDNRDALDLATVYIDRLHNNRRFEVKFSGPCKDLVEMRAQREYDETDKRASPRISSTQFDGANYSKTVIWYSMD